MIILVIVISRLPAWAGTTGKIAGQVVDKDSREPLVGVNLTLEGTKIGGVTDEEGRFTILAVPPGMYNVKASLVGYAATILQQVRVDIDQTTTLALEMSQVTVNVAEVVISAERPAVQRDVSTSVSVLSSDEVRALPVTTVTAVAGLQAGVQGLVIRGGGADQSLFLLDGATLRDPRNNQPITGVALSAVKEVSIERGGFNAEYGQLRSGIINVVTREGDRSAYTLSITGRYKPWAAKYDGVSPFDPSSMWLRPYLDPAVAWTGTENGAWDEFTRRQYPKFDGWNAISARLLTDSDPTNDLSPAAAQRLFEWQHRRRPDTKAPDYDVDLGFGGPFPLLSDQLGNLRFFLSYRTLREVLMVPLSRPDYKEHFGSLRLTTDLGSGMKLDLSATLSKRYTVAANGTEQVTSTDYIRSPDQISQFNSLQPATSSSRIFVESYYGLADIANNSFAAQLSNVISPTAYYDIRVEYISSKYNTGPLPSRNTSSAVELFPGYFVDEAPFGWSSQPDVAIDGMLMGGHTSTARDNSKFATVTLKADFTTQLDRHNQVKTGIEFAYNDLNVDYGILNLVFPESNTLVLWHRYPLRGSAYLQDKLEFEGFIANLGVRADYSTLRAQWPAVATFDRSFYSANFNPLVPYPTEESRGQLVFSPRLGISHPISENSKLFFNYGHFRQLSTYEQLFRLSRGANQEIKNIGDPNLAMARTIAYELGYDHSIADEYLFQLAAFYRDISNEQDFQSFQNARGDIIYQKATSNAYEDIRGFEVTVRKTSGRWWNGFVNYTYPVSSSGHFGTQQVYEDPSLQRQYDLQTSNAYQSRPVPQPYARISVGFFTPEDLGESSITHTLLGGWNVTLLGDWVSGGYVTWNPNQVVLSSPNVRQNDWYNLNLRLTKELPVGPLKVLLFVDVTNVFDTRRLNLNSFYDFNDQLDYYNSLHLPASNAYNNIVGSDKAGDYRKSGVDFVPIVQTGDITSVTNPNARAIYYNTATGTYMNYLNGQWSEVEGGRLTQVLDDKAYIDMPNQTSFNFLNPRSVFFGITTTIQL